MNTVLCYSGGHDSIYLAYKLLTSTTDDITLLILCSDDDKCHWGLRSKQVELLQKGLKELKGYRDFSTIFHTVDVTKITSLLNDSQMSYAVEFMAPLINNSTYDQVSAGRSWEQTDGYYFNPELGLNIKGFATDINAQRLAKKLFTRGSFTYPLVDSTFHKNYGRWHLFKYLPSTLLAASISYAIPPDYSIDPNANLTSEKINDKFIFDYLVKQKIEEGYTLEDYTVWRQEKDLEYGGGDNRSCLSRIWAGREVENNSKYLPGPNHVLTKEQFKEWYKTTAYKDFSMFQWNVETYPFLDE